MTDGLHEEIAQRIEQLNNEAFETACVWSEDGFLAADQNIPEFESVKIDAETLESVLGALSHDDALAREFFEFASLGRQRMLDQFMLFAVAMGMVKIAHENADEIRLDESHFEKLSPDQRDEARRRRTRLQEKIARLRKSCDHRQFAERIDALAGLPLVDGLQVRALAIVLGEDAALLARVKATLKLAAAIHSD